MADSVRDLVVALKENNTELDSLTIVYCNDGSQERHKLDQKALRLLAHES